MRFAVASVAALLFAVCAFAAAPRAPFPLVAGKKWTLVHPGSGVTRVVRLQRVDGELVLRGFPGLGATPVRGANGGVDARHGDHWERFLRLSAPRGTAYAVSLGRGTLWESVTVTVASRTLSVTDADGAVHRNCVQLRVSAPKGIADAGVEELAFAPGLGLVRVTESTIAGPRQLLYTTGSGVTH